MQKYVCTICGFIYEESLGYPKDQLVAGTKWHDVPETWKCPLCGAPKSAFEASSVTSTKTVTTDKDSSIDLPETITYTVGELAAIFSNLSKGWEKQYQVETAELCKEIADYYTNHSKTSSDTDWTSLKYLLDEDLKQNFTQANKLASDHNDRGGLRALKWAEQVSRMANSHIESFINQGPSFIENNNIYVCEICGFIYIGEEKPDLCPVCKVPSLKLTKVERSA